MRGPDEADRQQTQRRRESSLPPLVSSGAGSTLTPLCCTACGYMPGEAAWRCPRCGGLLERAEVGPAETDAAVTDAAVTDAAVTGGAVTDAAVTGAASADEERYLPAEARAFAASHWRYHALFPQIPFSAWTSLGEGLTPLIRGDDGRSPEWRDLWLKLDFLQPSGSYKDRGVSVMISYLRAQGLREVHDDSSGNAGVSLASYAAAAGMRCHIYVPETTSRGKLAQLQLLGAEVHAVAGGRAAAREAALAADAAGFYAAHNWHPAFIDGMESLGYELAEQVAVQVCGRAQAGGAARESQHRSLPGSRPWHVVVPAGHGSLVLGIGRAWRRLARRSSPDDLLPLPHIWAVQASGDAPLAWAIAEGRKDVDPDLLRRPRAETVAEGVAGSAPTRGRELLQILAGSGGGVVTVDDRTIATAMRSLLLRGLFTEPTSAAAMAGVTVLRAQERLPEGEPIVVVLTGHGLKGPEKVEHLLQDFS